MSEPPLPSEQRLSSRFCSPGLDAGTFPCWVAQGGQKEGFSTLLAEGWMSEFRQAQSWLAVQTLLQHGWGPAGPSSTRPCWPPHLCWGSVALERQGVPPAV